MPWHVQHKATMTEAWLVTNQLCRHTWPAFSQGHTEELSDRGDTTEKTLLKGQKKNEKMCWAFITFILQFSIVFLVSRPVKMPTTPVLHLQCEVRRLRLHLQIRLRRLRVRLRFFLAEISRFARSIFSVKPKRPKRRWRQATRVHLEATPATSPWNKVLLRILFQKTSEWRTSQYIFWSIKVTKVCIYI